MKFARVALAVGFVLSILAGPLAAEAQPARKVAHLGVLLFSTPAADPNLPAFLGVYVILATSRAGTSRSSIAMLRDSRSGSKNLRSGSHRSNLMSSSFSAET